jgi:hypothetical protein
MKQGYNVYTIECSVRDVRPYTSLANVPVTRVCDKHCEATDVQSSILHDRDCSPSLPVTVPGKSLKCIATGFHK